MSETSLRARKKARLRVELTRAAVALAEEHGFGATTVEQIAAKADTSPRTFFRYYATKEDVLFGDTPERLESLRSRLTEAAGSDEPIALLKAALTEQIDSFTNFEDPELEAACARLWVTEPGPRRRYIEIVLEWETVISEHLAQCWSRPADSVECRVTAMALIAAVRVCLERGAEGLEAAEQVLHDGFALLARGIGDAQLRPADQ